MPGSGVGATTVSTPPPLLSSWTKYCPSASCSRRSPTCRDIVPSATYCHVSVPLLVVTAVGVAAWVSKRVNNWSIALTPYCESARCGRCTSACCTAPDFSAGRRASLIPLGGPPQASLTCVLKVKRAGEVGFPDANVVQFLGVENRAATVADLEDLAAGRRGDGKLLCRLPVGSRPRHRTGH